jgi:hypothetical protein
MITNRSRKVVLGLGIGRVIPQGKDIEVVSDVPVRGDIAASGITVLPWREKIIAFSVPTFPSPVWVIARADSPLKPIVPSGSIEQDIAAVKTTLRKSASWGRRTRASTLTCLTWRGPAARSKCSVAA